MRIPSGKVDQVIYFVAVDATDLKTRETGLTSFTVYRSRNGGAATTYTTPTVTELSAANMPGVYSLLIDEDTTIASGSDSEEYCVHITQAAMAPVTRTIELYRRDTTTGNTLSVSAAGRALSDVDTIKTQTVTCSGGVTVPAATLASTTNISAATGVVLSGVTHTGAVIPTVSAVTGLTAANLDVAVSSRMASYTQPTGFLAATFPTGTIANTTNITAGTITTATNVTTVNGLAANVITSSSIAADAITSAKIATGAIDADALATDAVTEIWAGSTAPSAATIADAVWDEARSGHVAAGSFGEGVASVQGNVTGSVGSVTGAVTVGTNNDKTGYRLSATGVDDVWDEATAGHTTAGTTGKALIDAGSAGDPWSTALPGAYGAGTAGNIVGNNLNATITSRASQTSLDTVDDFIDTEVAAIKAKTDNLPVDPADASDIAALIAALPSAAVIADAVWDEDATAHQTQGTFGQAIGDPVADTNSIYKAVVTDATGATVGADIVAVKAETASIQADTDNIQTRLPAALVSGRMDASVGAMATDTITSAALAASAVTEIQSGLSTLDAAGVRSAVGLASANLDTQLDAIPTAAETADAIWDEALSGHTTAGSAGKALSDSAASGSDPWATALPGAYGAGTAGNILGTNLNATVTSRASQASLDAVDDYVDTEVAAIKAKTDQLTFTAAGKVDSNVKAVNDITVNGSGTSGSPWGP